MNDTELANMSDLELGAIERRVVDEKHRRARAKAVQGLAIKTCRACGEPLVTENYRIADGCPCNSPRGVNHGLVAKATCTCDACDPEQTGSTRYPAHQERLPHPGVPVGTVANARMTIRGQQAETIGGTPYGEHLEPKANGQQKDYVALSAEERAKGFVRPVRSAYVHVGTRPSNPTRELTPEERERNKGQDYVAYEAYPPSDGTSVVGRFWTARQLASGCGSRTSMGSALAETYARDPGFYSGTFCCACGDHFPVGASGEFVWDGTREKVGT